MSNKHRQVKKPTEPTARIKINATVTLSHLRWLLEGLRSAYSFDFSNCPIVKQLKDSLADAEAKDQNSIIAKQLQEESLAATGDEYVDPKYYLFAVRPSPKGLFDNWEDSVELHVCFKWDWYRNNQSYPFDRAGYLDEFDLSELGECEDMDGTVSWWTGDADKIRKFLTKFGMEEKPSLLDDYDNRKTR